MDIDTTPPAAHHEGRPSMQLDLPPSDDVMMEVDPEYNVMTAPLTSTATAYVPTSISSPTLHHHSAISGLSSPAHPASLSRAAFDPNSSTLVPLPLPPVALISSSDSVAWPKFKLDQLFVEWLARPESGKWLEGVLDAARKGKAPEQLIADQAPRLVRNERSVSPSPRASPSSQSPIAVSPQQAPGSPVSRLFSNHVPFGDSDSSPSSPPCGQPNSMSPFKSTLTAPVTTDFDLGRSGTVSPASADSLLKNSKSDLGGFKMVQQRSGAVLQSGSLPFTDISKSSRQVHSVLTELSEKQSTAFDAGKVESGSDTKTLDKVADGIRGMSADTDRDPLASQLAPTMLESAQNDARTMEEDTGTGKSNSVRMAGETGLASVLDGVVPVSSAEMARTNASKRGSLDGTVRRIGEAEPNAVDAAFAKTDSHMSMSTDAPTAQDQADLVTAQRAQPRKHTQDNLSNNFSRGDSTVDLEGRVSGDAGGATMDLGSHVVTALIPPSGPGPSKIDDKRMSDAPFSSKTRKHLPAFYYPCGKDAERRERTEMQRIKGFFLLQRVQKKLPGASRSDMAELVVEVIGLPSYFAEIVFNAILELFPHRKEQDLAPNSNLGRGTEEETAMKDIDSGGKSGAKSRGSTEGVKNKSGMGESGTNSDTTMGDVDDSHIDGSGANGDLNFTQAQGDSSNADTNAMNAAEESKILQTSGQAEFLREEQVTAYYNKFCKGHSKESRLFTVLQGVSSDRDYLIPGDFKPLLEALLMQHQGLAFLHATPEFQQRYSETVIERIYFGCTRQHNGRLTLHDIKRSKLLKTLVQVDEEEDINRERKYFSYEHFYVLYCRFWELDANHDLQIDREDLMRYGSHSLTYRIVDRIFGGYARPLDCLDNTGLMSYTDFIWFCLSEEDKTSDTAIDYWFRCVDMDGDGLITMYDMEYFYKEQLHRMECFGHEPVQIRDILCQLLDMINPNIKPPVIRRRDLKRCRLAGNFFNVLFNLNKFFAIEARDPLQIRQEHATPELTDWDRFAALEYLRLSAEEEGEEDESWEDVGDATNPLMPIGEAPF